MDNHMSNIDSRLSKLIGYPNAWILELAKGVWIIKVGLYHPYLLLQLQLLFK